MNVFEVGFSVKSPVELAGQERVTGNPFSGKKD
jgi:hypothetical protein